MFSNLSAKVSRGLLHIVCSTLSYTSTAFTAFHICPSNFVFNSKTLKCVVSNSLQLLVQYKHASIKTLTISLKYIILPLSPVLLLSASSFCKYYYECCMKVECEEDPIYLVEVMSTKKSSN